MNKLPKELERTKQIERLRWNRFANKEGIEGFETGFDQGFFHATLLAKNLEDTVLFWLTDPNSKEATIEVYKALAQWKEQISA